MKRYLSIKNDETKSLLKTQPNNSIKYNSDLNLKIDQLNQLHQQYFEQSECLKVVAADLACLEMQIKKIECLDIVPNYCDQCLGNSLKACGQCVIYISGHMKASPNKNHMMQQDTLTIVPFDEEQEDAYWL